MNVQQINMDSQLVNDTTFRIGFTGAGKMDDLYNVRVEYILKQTVEMDLQDVMHSVIIPIRTLLMLGNDGFIKRYNNPYAEHYLVVKALKGRDAWLQVEMGADCNMRFSKVFAATARRNIHKKIERRVQTIWNGKVAAY